MHFYKQEMIPILHSKNPIYADIVLGEEDKDKACLISGTAKK